MTAWISLRTPLELIWLLEHLFALTLNSLLLFLDNFCWASEFMRELFRIWPVFPSSDFLFQELYFSSLPLSLERAHLMVGVEQ